jgi:hypothetical protein
MSHGTEGSVVACSHHGGCALLGDGAFLALRHLALRVTTLKNGGCGETARGLKSALQRTCRDLP